MNAVIPVILFAYARPGHLARVLACLRENRVPLIYAYADGSKGGADEAAVTETRRLLREIDWCDVKLVERPRNMGLGRSVLAGVEEVAAQHDAFIVWEDDLICVPGTYAWICAALRRYAQDSSVMSVSAWTHPRVTPEHLGDHPYFDARGDCWVWGAWARSWRGMLERTAIEKLRRARKRGVGPDAYGADLPMQAAVEERRNVWAVRWLYHHFEQGGLCLRPPWSMVEHIGFDASATNATGSVEWANPPLKPVPPQPESWPPAVEHPDCRALWRAAYPSQATGVRLHRKIMRWGKRTVKGLMPASARARLRSACAPKLFSGDYVDWASARAASGGYDDGAILERVLASTLEVQAGRAAFERDSVLFFAPDPDGPLLKVLQAISHAKGGRLSVLDFGGSLGSTYWRHRGFLPCGDALRWDVVEQPAFVRAGRCHISEPSLHFYDDVQTAEAVRSHDVLLCSGVIQYLEQPFRFLDGWRRLQIPNLVLNNLPLRRRGPDILKVQVVPPSIYNASYPVWFFNREKFLKEALVGYDLAKEFDSEAVWPVGWRMFKSTGLWLKRKS